MTKIADIVEIREIPRALDPATLRRVRDALDQNDGAPSLLSGPDIDSLLERYVAIDGPADDPLYALLKQLAADPPAGAGFMMQGPAGSGKTHLLCVAALLLDYPSLRDRFVAANPRYAEPLGALARRRRPLVVPVALGEHRAEDENLEDIIFDCAEAELSRPLHRIQLPLSEQSYSLDLVSRHILPRYQAELDKHVRGRAGGFATWQDLADADPAGAVAAARLRDRQQARHLFRLARRLEPRVARHWARWATSLVPPIADRVWDDDETPVRTAEIAGVGAR